ncbi:MAG: acyltransferase family protein, partial [Bryobacteraceae bacterium]
AGRVFSLDAFRGFTMIWMISSGFGLAVFLNDPVLGPIARQFTHAEWHGFYPWDLIQPFFMFIVGAAMPYSFARRWAAGEPWSRSLRHVLARSGLLIFWGLVARSVQAGRPVVDLINVLAQIAFTYLVAFLLLRKSWQVQFAAAVGLLALHTALYRFVSAPGIQGPWVPNANFGWYVDGLILGKHWGGYYATINCLSSASATIWGVMAGDLLRSGREQGHKIRLLAAWGLVAIVTGLALDPVIPIIKKIWTASFAFYSAGYTLLALALFYWICDVQRWRRWAEILVIVGANSIFIYLFHEILGRWMMQTAKGLLGWSVAWWGPWGEVFTACTVIAFQVYVCWWLNQRKIFFKL